MAATAVSTVSLNITYNNQLFPLSGSASLTTTGDKPVVKVQTATSSWVALDISPAASAGKLLLKVLTSTGGAESVKIALDNADAKVISDGIPEGESILLVKVPAAATLYIKRGGSNDIACAYAVVER